MEIFDDRIEVASPGRFPGLVSLRDPTGVVRYARNPRIARVLSDLGFGQELGEGIRRMHEEMELAGLQSPVYRQTASDVRVELSGETADRRIVAGLPAETREVVSALRSAERLSTGELAQVMGLARPGALRRLTKLRDAGVITWIGTSPKDPRAYWTLPPT